MPASSGGVPSSSIRSPRRFSRSPIPPAERDSYYGLVAVADGYFRAFQTNGTPDYHRADLQPDTRRFENGAQFTGNIRNGVYTTAPGRIRPRPVRRPQPVGSPLRGRR